jgi:hypothetical protein
VRRREGRVLAHLTATALAVIAAACAGAGTAGAATPDHGTLALGADGKGKIAWKGAVGTTPATAGASTDACFGADRKPDPTAGCDFFTLNVDAPPERIRNFIGSIDTTAANFGANDLDIAVYVRNPDGTKGYQVQAPAGAGGNQIGQPELYPLLDAAAPAKSYYFVAVPYSAAPGTSYDGAATFNLKPAKPTLGELNKKLGPGPANYRASHDKFVSHSEPAIAMDPLNHDHLIAGSKMYEDLPRYLFKAGTYESYNGGRTWTDLQQLPGYCKAPGQCDPNDEDHYRTVSDITLAYDDEGNAYANVLDAPGGTLAFTGFNMTAHIKQPGKPWSDPIVVHDNQSNALTQQVLLDDKNWLAVDNHTDVNGGPNRPHDGKIGTLYVCWSLDVSVNPIPGQQIVLERSTDGGHTWFGAVPGNDTPQQISQKGEVSGVGCHVAVGPKGEVYITWYDNQADALMQAKSTDRGSTFTPAHPIATITGITAPFANEAFRNLSIPTSAVGADGSVYVAVASKNGDGAPVVSGAAEGADPKHPVPDSRQEHEQGDAANGNSGSDIVVFKSSDGGVSYSGPVTVNQDKKPSDADQFQPWIAVTDKGQVDISYFDRRNDANDLFVDTWLSRSNDGGKTFHDTRVTHEAWDPRVNPPTSTSGEFIGDYQGLVADDNVAIPFWNDTQAANRAPGSSGYSPWQEVYAARIPNTPSKGGPSKTCRDRKAPTSKLNKRRVRVTHKAIGARGSSKDTGCKGNARAKIAGVKGRVKAVYVTVARVRGGGGCRFLQRDGKFTKRRSCRRGVLLPAKGTKKWTFSFKKRLPRGSYRLVVRAKDRAGNKEKPSRRNTISFKVR